MSDGRIVRTPAIIYKRESFKLQSLQFCGGIEMKIYVALLLMLVLSLISYGQKPKVFVAPMEEGFDNFITAALIKNKVYVDITTDESQAEYIITGNSVKGQNKWYDTVFGAERDRAQGSIRLLKVADKSVAWAGSAGDRSIWWGAMKRGGQEKVANRLARKLKTEFFNKRRG